MTTNLQPKPSNFAGAAVLWGIYIGMLLPGLALYLVFRFAQLWAAFLPVLPAMAWSIYACARCAKVDPRWVWLVSLSAPGTATVVVLVGITSMTPSVFPNDSFSLEEWVRGLEPIFLPCLLLAAAVFFAGMLAARLAAKKPGEGLDWELLLSLLLALFMPIAPTFAARFDTVLIVVAPVVVAMAVGFALSAIRRKVRPRSLAWFVMIVGVAYLSLTCWDATRTQGQRSYILLFWKNYFGT